MTSSTDVDPEAVQATLERILASTKFARSDQLARFLRFIVAETLAGRADRLKEYTIGIEALGRPVRFDPTVDSVVRVQARQLRFKLAEYFAGQGKSDPVRIELPKGSYVPAFHVASTTEQDPPPRERSWRWPALAGLAAVAVFVVGAISLPRKSRAPAESAGALETPAVRDATPSLVVLPFLNLTGDPGQDYVSDGVTDELTAALANVHGLRVVARTSAYQFKTHPADVRTIGRQLGVESVLEGSVRRTGDVLRITVQLSRANDGVHLWAASFDEKSQDLLSADEAVARAVVDAFGRIVAPRLGLAPPALPTHDAEAYRLYLEAHYLSNRRDSASMVRARDLFQRAIARDTAFAMAYAGLAGVHATMAINGLTRPGVSPPLAESAARKALALDPGIGDAHAVLGAMQGFVHWDWARADSEFRRAIELTPNLARAHAEYAVTLIARGRIDDALAQLRYAQRLDPLSYPIAYSIGEALYYARRWDEALAQAQTVIDMDSTFRGGAYNLQWRVYAATGRHAEALDIIRKANDTSAAIIALAGLGRTREARDHLAALTPDLRARVPYYVAALHAAVGDRDDAFAWLERAYQAHQTDIVSMKVDPQMDPLRGDPRFQVLLARIGLADR